MTLRLRRSAISLPELRAANRQRVDNTGNVCQWPAEEVLAWHCAQRLDRFQAARVLELGAGQSGLAGLLVAAAAPAACVHLSDGNAAAVDLLRANARLNCCGAETEANLDAACVGVCGTTRVEVAPLLWDRAARYDLPRFDFVLISDCLFFEEFHCDLLHVLRSTLAPRGEAWICGPRRGASLERFAAAAREHFEVELSERFDERVWQQHSSFVADCAAYEPDRHQPLRALGLLTICVASLQCSSL